MSTPQAKAAILEERARKLAQRDTGSAVRSPWAEVVVMEAGSSTFGVPSTELRVVVAATPITPLPGLPPFMLGVAHVRGELLSVIDLTELRGVGRIGHAPLFAVVEVEARALAISVSSVLGFRTIHASELEPSLLHEQGEDSFTKAVTKDLVIVIDVPRLLRSDRLIVGASGGSSSASGETPK